MQCMLNRRALIRLINASFHAERPDYARSLARGWLEKWPNDIRVQFALGRAYDAEGRADAGLGILTELISLDPEHAPAQILTRELAASKGLDELADLAGAVATILEGKTASSEPWTHQLIAGRQALQTGDCEAAREAAEQAILNDRPTPLPSLLLLQAHWVAKEFELAQPLAQAFAERWPKCIAFTLALADCLLNNDDAAAAVHWLHTTAALDPASEVVRRYWGRDHQFAHIWPASPFMEATGPVPIEVAALLGANQLGPALNVNVGNPNKKINSRTPKKQRKQSRPMPQSKSRKKVQVKGPKQSQPETLKDIEEEIERGFTDLDSQELPTRLNFRRKPNTRHHRRPVHIILTSKKNLTAKYGPEVYDRLADTFDELLRTTRQYTRRRTLLLLSDDPDSLKELGLEPVDQNNPWQVKLLLHDLNHRLARRGQTIGSLFIIGGDDIVPFHRLPNPTDDIDDDVPSDNPYGALDENYFVPDWPVGRLATPCSPESALLETVLRNAINAHRRPPKRLRFPFNLIRLIFPDWQPGANPRNSFGYSADVWEKASRLVYDPIGFKDDLATSPPSISKELPQRAFAPLDLSYFNLHGLEDTPEWYGQRVGFEGNETLYPMALRPADIPTNGRAPQVVLSEACYGANILNKQSSAEAICLRFLEAGSLAVVGSTRLSYGSVARPLIAADLLGHYFWEALLTGLPTGEALRIAKLEFAQEMHERQGFLDGEDQKTLISFMLYGDPLITAPGVLPPVQKKSKSSNSVPKRLSKSIARPICTIGELVPTPVGDERNADTLARVKSLASRYLPDVDSWNVQIHAAHLACEHNDHECFASHSSSKGIGADPKQLVYTVGTSQSLNGHISHHFARITVNQRGSIIKMAVTR